MSRTIPGAIDPAYNTPEVKATWSGIGSADDADPIFDDDWTC